MASVGKHIKQFRTARGLTQEDLAEKLFVTRQAVSAWETGKALPDLEALERIAAALDADVTEMIYGVPRSPDLRNMKRRWALIGGGTAVIAALFMFALVYFDFVGTWANGLSYQFDDLDYDLSFTEVPGAYSVDIDLANPDSNVGKVLYEDKTGCRIVVEALDLDESDHGYWQIFFRAEGICRQTGGTLVTASIERPAGKRAGIFRSDLCANLTTTADGTPWPGKLQGMTGLQKNGNYFGYYLFHAVYDSRAGTASGFPNTLKNDIVTITLEGLTQFTAQRR
jgi:transcriptional regulator with XRE-family HTH domain